MSLVKRKLTVKVELGEGQYGESGFNAVELSDFRVSARIIKAGGNSMGTANLQIFGMTQSKMNQLSTLGFVPTTIRRNTVTVLAGDDESGMTPVFDGTITNAYGAYESVPEVPFNIIAHTGRFEAAKPVEATSYRGATDVATILEKLAKQMGMEFENNGVNAKLTNSYFPGTARDQALAVVRQAGICWNGLDGKKLAIWPAGNSRSGDTTTISPSTGMIGFPSYTAIGITVRTLFNPNLRMGGKIKVESSLKGANGEWVVYALNYELDAQIPKGKWFSTLSAAPPGYVVVA